MKLIEKLLTELKHGFTCESHWLGVPYMSKYKLAMLNMQVTDIFCLQIYEIVYLKCIIMIYDSGLVFCVHLKSSWHDQYLK